MYATQKETHSLSRLPLKKVLAMKNTLPILGVIVLAGALGACGTGEIGNGSDATETTTVSSNTTVPSSTSATLTMTSTATAAPRDAAATEPEAAPPVAAPYVVQCEPGIPGPALWSDGSTRFSQDCYDQGVANRGSYRCPHTDSYVDDPSKCAPWQRDETPLDQISYADGGTCPAYKCGYGHDANGNPNPTSGETQLMNGCEKGYINDPEKCEAVARKAAQYGW